MTSIARDAPVFVTGHTGLVGSAVVRKLESEGYSNLLVAQRDQLDLRDPAAVNEWFRTHRPSFVFLVAGTVGGIMANATRPAEFLYDNMMIAATVIEAARRYDVEKLLYLGSSCIYPRLAVQPMNEEQLLTGPLEPTNEAYAIAKIAGIKLCQSYRAQYGCNFISAIPTNLYGPGDNFELESAHVPPALLRKFHDAKVEGRSEVKIWGSGQPRREFLHVDDLAAACTFLMEHLSDAEHVNVGTGIDITIHHLAEIIRDIVHPDASLVFDSTYPDGMPQKVLDTAKIRQLGWSPRIDLAVGLRRTYDWFLAQSPGRIRGIEPLNAAV